ncbi:MAG: hypothetical protein J1E05_07950 [Eubacterium sp.]|nr:hypothetical protein [Eubacterium sp.]
MAELADKYTTDPTGSWITNIPYSDYIRPCTPGGKCVVANISPSASGESNSEVINTEIDKLSVFGGGTLVIPEGAYKITSVELKSNVTLFISKGAKLVALSYDEKADLKKNDTPDHISDGVIFANNAENIRITGGGIICGSGISYTDEPKNEAPLYALKEFNTYKRVIEARNRIRFGKQNCKRSYLMLIKNCKNVIIDDVVLNESAFWTLVINGCENVDINHIVIDNHMHVANTDGIDILFSRNVNIDTCFIATADDGICLKPVNGEIKDVNVSNCIVSSCANCFKIGTETAFDISDIRVRNCKFFMPQNMTYGYSGIAVESADGSNVSNVEISDIFMDGISSPILVWLGKRLRHGNFKIGSVKNIKISNVTAVNTELPSAVTGCRDDEKIYPVEGVVLENISAVYRDTNEALDINYDVPEWSMDDYPDIVRISHIYKESHENSDYWDLPCYGIFIRYTKDVDYSGYSCEPRKCNERSFEYVKNE